MKPYERHKAGAVLLAIVFGGIGVHKCYLRRYTSFLLYILFCWTCIPLVLSWIDAAAYLFMPKHTFDARYNA